MQRLLKPLLRQDFPARANIYALILALLIAALYNASFWKAVYLSQAVINFHKILFLVAFFLLVSALFYALFSIVSIKYVLKPLAIGLVFSAATASYFMSAYGTIIDQAMLASLLETNSQEATDFINLRFALHFFGFGVIPAFVLWRIRIRFHSGLKQLGYNLISVVAGVLVIAIIGFVFYADLASTLRTTPQLKLLIVPLNYIRATSKYVAAKSRPHPGAIRRVAADATRDAQWASHRRRTVFVFVLGETARAQNFSLDGYARDTNPRLSKRDVVNYENVASCGTSTVNSVPCIFSYRGRKHFSGAEAEREESILDVLVRVGFDVIWRDNNTGCKGVCNRVVFQNYASVKNNPFCNDQECFDEVLLDGLDKYLHDSDRDTFLVLHQKGSHGPAYFRRAPPRFKKFAPGCETSNLQDCSFEQIQNSYDNTILYTDFFLSRLIALLEKKENNIDAVMVYASDHGESLGENGMYLHGIPYFMAPKEQTHVPMLLWLSENFRQDFHVDQHCLAAAAHKSISHDNIFHSVLGLLRIKTSVYKPELDVSRGCLHHT